MRKQQLYAAVMAVVMSVGLLAGCGAKSETKLKDAAFKMADDIGNATEEAVDAAGSGVEDVTDVAVGSPDAPADGTEESGPAEQKADEKTEKAAGDNKTTADSRNNTSSPEKSTKKTKQPASAKAPTKAHTHDWKAVTAVRTVKEAWDEPVEKTRTVERIATHVFSKFRQDNGELIDLTEWFLEYLNTSEPEYAHSLYMMEADKAEENYRNSYVLQLIEGYEEGLARKRNPAEYRKAGDWAYPSGTLGFTLFQEAYDGRMFYDRISHEANNNCDGDFREAWCWVTSCYFEKNITVPVTETYTEYVHHDAVTENYVDHYECACGARK